MIDVVKKLKLKETGVIINAPSSIESEFLQLGFANQFPEEKAKVALLFVTNSEELIANFEPVVSKLIEDAHFWICYPKGTSKIKTDINRDILWKMIEPYGFSPVMMVAIDETWSAMRVRPSALIKRK
jgi:hypothetical protein